ncbi:cyclic nucleotide-gated ion channel 4-like [Phoenix dactylifera]|uniref:Cyclic nucleotide-gated ion channel 4-like n=1 Tax=Phoenix dactylifera TaxID=42345 RepID=A0A8B9A681_PHODC|nr:cyclic nucleotide-gated ion channel 4-like [Phoenix dactylifera]
MHPLLQVVLWVAAPVLICRGLTTMVMTVFLVMFLFQYLPKIYHCISFLRRLQNSSGYIFGTIWWGIAINLIAYFVAAHAIGACWYLLGIQRAANCLNEQCIATKGCGLKAVGCANPIYYGITTASRDGEILSWANNANAREVCLDSQDKFDYGTYKWTVLLITNSSRLEKILLPIFWGLMNLTTFGGGLESTTEWHEILFNIIVITAGLLLVTMLIGNIKVFLHSATSKKQALHLKMRSLDWWMRKRQLPKGIRHRVRQYERQRWAAMRGVDECKMIQDLPEGLRKEIKYHLCLDLVRQVPLFQHMDELVLENICDRVKSLIFPKGETITREGDPVQRMLFIVRGHLQSSQALRNGIMSCCMLGPGNFSGDELLSWCLRRPFIERLPPSSSTLVTLETTEAFSLEAGDVKYVTQNFRYTFANEKVKRSARYYSPGWRTWAAVAIQLAWRRYKLRLTLASLSFIRPRRPASRCSSPGEERLRHYAALLTSPKPNQDALP